MPNRVLHHCWAACEAYVCSPCQGLPLDDDAPDLLDEIDRLLPEAKTDEQRAHVSALGAALDEARGGAA
jgi:hypothetical protein